MKLITLLEALNAPYDYFDEDTYTRGVKKYIFQSANGDYYHVIIQTSMNLTYGITMRVDFYNETHRAREDAKGDQGDVDTAGGIMGTGDAFRIFSTVIEIVREYVERAAPGTIMFKGRTDPSRIKLYQRFAQNIGKALPGYQFFKAVNDKEAGYDVITFMCKKIKPVTESADGPYEDERGYRGRVPEIKYLPVKAIKRREMDFRPEVMTVPDDVAKNMDYSEPVECTAFRYGDDEDDWSPVVTLDDGHHRTAAAIQTGRPWLPVDVRAMNAKGKKLNALIRLSKQVAATYGLPA